MTPSRVMRALRARIAGAPPSPVAPPPDTCPACGSDRVADYCAGCGAALRAPRRRALDFFDDFLNSTVKGDSRTLRSLTVMARRPGELSRAAVEGRGARYTTPTKMFFAVILLYAVFFAFSPVKFGQLWLGTDQDYAAYESLPFLTATEGEWTGLYIHFFTPDRESMFEPHLTARLEAGEEDVAVPPFDSFVSLYRRPAEEMRVREAAQTMLTYGPLLILLPAITLNGLLHRRRRYLVDHLLYGFELAAAFPLMVILTSLLVAGAHAAGLSYPNDPMNSPVFLFVVLPLLFVYALRSDRRFYESGWLAASVKALFLLAGWYFVFEVFAFRTLTVLASGVAA